MPPATVSGILRRFQANKGNVVIGRQFNRGSNRAINAELEAYLASEETL